eukprot:666594-Pelagomonas_calceolata.AAC.3
MLCTDCLLRISGTAWYLYCSVFNACSSPLHLPQHLLLPSHLAASGSPAKFIPKIAAHHATGANANATQLLQYSAVPLFMPANLLPVCTKCLKN